MCYYIGILGISLGTTGVLIAEDGAFQQRARSAAGMEWRDGRHGSAAQVVRQIVDELAEQQQLPFASLLRDVGRITVAMPGLDPRQKATRFLTHLLDYQINPESTHITSVAEAGFAGAFHCNPGLLIRTGHGSSAFFKVPNGGTCFVGDSGLLFGDHGSSSWLGKKAFQALTKVRDLRGVQAETDFCYALCREVFGNMEKESEQFDLPFIRLEQARSVEFGLGVRKYLTDIGKVTTKLAASGDPIAQAFVVQGQRHLLELVKEPLTKQFTNGQKLPVCIRGSLAEDSVYFREGLVDLLSQDLASCVQPIDGLNGSHSSAVGIGLLALEPDTTKLSKLSIPQSNFIRTVQSFPWSQPNPRFLRRPPSTDMREITREYS